MTGVKFFRKIFGKYLIIHQILQTREISKNYFKPFWLCSQRVKQKNVGYLWIPCYSSFFFLDNASHKFWDQPSSTHYQCSLQASVTVFWWKFLWYYSFNILQQQAVGRGLISFCKVGHSRISINFFRNRLGLNNLCENM